MATPSQEDRLVSIETPLGQDVLFVRHFNATEAISRLFSFHLDLFSEKPSLPLDGLIGKPVTITLEIGDDGQRFFHGIVSRFGRVGRGQTGRDPRFTAYNAEVVPWLWFLTRTSDCRIFQNLTVPDIIKKVFQDLGFRDFRLGLTRTYTQWDYCVQYRETDFNFVSRLMEQEGIFYFFEHERGKHTLVLADSADAHKPCPGQAKARFSPEGGVGEREDNITSWDMEQELRPGKYTLRDYHFEMPSKSLEVSTSTTVPGGGKSNFEIYDYQGEYTQQFNKPGERLGEVEPEGEKLVKLRMQEEETSHLLIRGVSTCRGFIAGYRFELQEPPPGVTAGPYVLTSVEHAATQGGDFASGWDTGVSYTNSFSCIPQQVLFRPARVTPKPVIQGTQTAMVVGPAGEEIFTDKYGRVKVQFHWDREGKQDENSSSWVRVGSIWAGKQWGGIHIPRIGQEVVVAFQEGDPDQPIIIGSVYNAEQMPPYGLPANKTQSGIKSRSSLGGGDANFNEIRFEDKKGNEELYIHAEKDENIVVENNKTEFVGASERITITSARTESVGSNETLSVGVNRSRSVGKNETISIAQNKNETVGQDLIVTVGKNMSEFANLKVQIEAGVELKLIGPGGSITLDASGVTIQGVLVKIN